MSPRGLPRRCACGQMLSGQTCARCSGWPTREGGRMSVAAWDPPHPPGDPTLDRLADFDLSSLGALCHALAALARYESGAAA